MAGVNREYVVPGNGRDITVRLDGGTAERLGAKPVEPKEPVQAKKVEAKEAEKPANKARTARSK